MNAADIVLAAIILISSLIGLWRGFVSEVMSLLVWIAAFWIALAFGDEVANGLAKGIESPLVRALIGYIGLFLLTLVVGGLVTWLIGRIIASTGLSGTDRLFGLVFGVLRGAVVCAALILLLGFTAFPREPWWQQSRLIAALQPAAAWLAGFLPASMGESR